MPGVILSHSQPLRAVTITPRGKEIDLEDEIGISISIPRDAVAKIAQLNIATSFSGAYETPGGMESVSPAYIIDGKEVEFSKDVEVKLQHTANLETAEDCRDMVVMEACSTPTYSDSTPVYKFEELEGTKVEFDLGNSSAVIKGRSFSSVYKIFKTVKRRLSQGLIKSECS